METEYIAGKHSVLEALRSQRSIHKIWIADQTQKSSIHQILSEAKTSGTILQYVDKKKLEQMVPGVKHQGVVAQVASYQYAELDDLLAAAADKDENPFFLILDEIEDPHNLGSILRSCDCTGVHGVIIPKRRSAGLTASVSKTSAGAVEHIPVARVTNLGQTIDKLKKQGIWIAGADVSAEQNIYRTDFTLPIGIVIGNEHKGIGRLIKEKCDFLIKLPMFGRINSLNASVAAGVIMYEVVRQRH
ncbi:23S rRNA (guanosine(2251)-2'-O)-methyltransferase RlmB [Chengkuizengella axinellae]|uniref:23S rRNA (Guanosine(2251)-2'-O)-methyltransferase RlmB n=1 Tax=Chengkuizengella axinellae TaxID=3064388 RepID=A0ABT9J5H5_9BACL|nr:23S rRNA (guanosine(2251)-2'-O)-methyltransferase RlmB [Chengkuizengella sp. 2205SS18-9]MDP5276862.1 23S rRNA (guanosine(2251)-2'-O)-methyltransferase RlmB [Chengkuizengella sp. 2205SS18-9]